GEICERTFLRSASALARMVLVAQAMSKQPIKKLSLKSELLRSLTPDDLVGVGGGKADEPMPPRNPAQAFSGKPEGCLPKSLQVLQPCGPRFPSGIVPCIPPC